MTDGRTTTTGRREAPLKLLIRGGRVLDPATGRDEHADVTVADGRIVRMGCSFRSPNLRGMTVEARGTVTAVRDEDGERLVDLDLIVVDHDNPDTVLVPATATVALA